MQTSLRKREIVSEQKDKLKEHILMWSNIAPNSHLGVAYDGYIFCGGYGILLELLLQIALFR